MTPEAEALIHEHLDLVKQVASRLARKLPAFVEMSEIVSAGNVGLVEAAVRFNPELHASFKVWAMIRIRGAIIDAYRGRNYPRLNVQMPESWGSGTEHDGARWTLQTAERVPSALIDQTPSILDVLIERQESVVVIGQAVRAHQDLPPREREAVSEHLDGRSLRDIGRRKSKSGAWAHYTLSAAKRKMRQQIDDEREAA